MNTPLAHVAVWRIDGKYLPRYVTWAPPIATWISLVRRSIRPEMRHFNTRTKCWEVSVSCGVRFWPLLTQHWMNGLCEVCASRRECPAWTNVNDGRHHGALLGWDHETEWRDRGKKPKWPTRINNRTDALRILGLRGSVSDEEIAKAWRKRALLHHPDRGGDHEMIVLVNAAYEWLRK